MGEIFIGEIRSGIWKFINPDHFKKWCQSKNDGKYQFPEPTNVNDKRNINQNRLLWKRSHELSNATGYTANEIHSFIMESAGFLHEKTIFGKIIVDRISSTELNKSEFSRLFKEQDKIAYDLNDGLPVESWLKLTTTDPLINEN